MAKRQPTITNRVLLMHMQAGHEALKSELKTALKMEIHRLDEKIEELKRDMTSLKGDVAELKRNDEKTHAALQRLYERRVEMVEELADHEKRLTHLEKAAA